LEFDYDSYAHAQRQFSWDLPEVYNIATDCLGKHGENDVALYQAYPGGHRETHTFGDLDRLSSAFADALGSLGVKEGDRVAIVGSQRPETALTHLACWKRGAISVPVSVLEGTDGLRYRLSDSGAQVTVVGSDAVETLEEVRSDLPSLSHVVEVDDEPFGKSSDRFRTLCDSHDQSFQSAETTVETPAIIIYTSGTTGRPKGVLHSHGVWLGSLPGFNMYFDYHTGPGTVFYTTSDWSWIAGLGNVLVPAWHYGRPAVGFARKSFDPHQTLDIMATFDVTNVYVPPTAIRLLMDVTDPTDQYDLSMSVVGCGGEPVTEEVVTWVEETLDATLNESYGQTEANVLVSNCRSWFDSRVGSMGKPVPGHEVAVIDPEEGTRKSAGETGEIAVQRGDDPMVFEEYWNAPERMAATNIDGWHLTGDLAHRDEDGYVWFEGRSDGIIITSGYRVSPVEVERTLLDHEAVEQVYVTGTPEEERGEVITAYVVTQATENDRLRDDIQSYARSSLAAYKYPRRIEFVDEHATTASGKLNRETFEE